jgi:fructokinase
MRSARGRLTVSYDPNVRLTLMGDPERTRAIVEGCVAMSDVVKASEEDVAWLYGSRPLVDVLDHWSSLGPTLCAVTRGSRGVVALAAGTLHELPNHPTRVVDTVGAGDSFMAGLVSGLLDAQLLGCADARNRLRSAPWEAVRPSFERALACAAITVSRAGANPPRSEELQTPGSAPARLRDAGAGDA